VDWSVELSSSQPSRVRGGQGQVRSGFQFGAHSFLNRAQSNQELDKRKLNKSPRMGKRTGPACFLGGVCRRGGCIFTNHFAGCDANVQFKRQRGGIVPRGNSSSILINNSWDGVNRKETREGGCWGLWRRLSPPDRAYIFISRRNSPESGSKWRRDFFTPALAVIGLN
jgi:hypothetical protein